MTVEEKESESGLRVFADVRAGECKVCGGTSPLFGVVDFHKCCEEARGKRLALSGVPVYYRRCERCGFCFTNDFDGWRLEEFARHIYNAEYGLVDPDYAEARPEANARMVAESFAEGRDAMRILDYGGGEGVLAERLRERGFDAGTYDPFTKFGQLPEGKFDLITAFEVMEHLPWPRRTVAEMAGLLEEDGAILFSTLLQPEEFAQEGLGWWYAAPRNGHISLYTPPSLGALFGDVGLRAASFSPVLHLAWRGRPQFAAHMLGLNAGSEREAKGSRQVAEGTNL